MKDQQTYQVIGLMSGTSLDGLDMAYCEFSLENNQWQFRIPVAETQSYDDTWQQKLKNITEVSGEELIIADRNLGVWMGEAVKEFILKHQLKPDFIASHGHTVFHQPERGITYQIGNPFAMQAVSKQTVVSQFRNYDVAIGGQGAPLVPIGDQLLFGEYDACLNLGGIANLSTPWQGKRIAYDIGTSNMVMNYFAQQSGKPYDQDGQLAQQGHIDQSLVDALNQLPYYRQDFPKSLGYEWVHREIIRRIEHANLSVPDAIATALDHAAYQISQALQFFAAKQTEPFQVLVTGGGAFNDYFMDSIRRYAAEGIEMIAPPAKIIAFKEALVFALLGVLRVRNEINCLQSVTGAQYDHSAGVIFGNID
ncbi:anhydro-N-acetylmuramic acid kinase [Tunicatimonas pelagia]|uniref:anhydro-N-acetylmuramic acid kinase n=1 Tax=Tunicatimonas pelagia TaxID=931531 RepID=UPI0026669013|nr:anhydro-N-acetylmuramic acid kinase [Tunicatimonas pelagia]WKN45187.1 anhydro-N-acetylmuramic acid kinase [Tunicatimonas pelagia]